MSRGAWVVDSRTCDGRWVYWTTVFQAAEAEEFRSLKGGVRVTHFVELPDPQTQGVGNLSGRMPAATELGAEPMEEKADDGLRERLRYVLPSRFQSEYTLISIVEQFVRQEIERARNGK